MFWKRLQIETPEAANVEEPVTLDFVKQHVRQPVVDADDDYLFTLIHAARNIAEGYTKRAFVARTATLVLSGFPPWEILLPYGAAQSVTSIVYGDSSGAPQTLDGAASPAVFQTDLSDQSHAVIWPLRTSTWPASDPLSIAPVTITWEAGYGSADDVPHVIRLGIARQVARWYDARSDIEELEFSPMFRMLLDPYALERSA